MIEVYADETGTHGLKEGGKEPAPGIYGFMDTPEHWESFRLRWSTFLKKYNVPYFHFRELNPNERKKTNNPYFGWDNEKVDDFIHDMAVASSCRPIPFGGFVSIRGLYGGRRDKATHHSAYALTFEQFFGDFTQTINKRFPNDKSKVSFFFDDNRNAEWVEILYKVFKKSQKIDRRIAEFTMVKAKSERGIPCQAADLLAYVNRQKMETTYETGRHQQTRLLDFITSRNGFPNDHPRSLYAKYSDVEWEELIKNVRADKKLKNTKDAAAGLPEQTYYPFEHHLMLKAQLWKMYRENPSMVNET